MAQHQTDTSAALHRIMTDPAVGTLDVAAAFGVSRSKAYESVKAGDWPSIKVRGCVRIPSAWVRAQLMLEDPAVSA
ncbi:helix-turn-helix domain-containing protein [Rhodococcus sp. BP-332]|uniref:helix-turn-helix domain-containing protein n=1 Tax=Rhodococcus sp. BP-332 TaxID=2739447 RepID=UPI001C9A4D0A|nr:helix-turn-helix domain-containing protein [Rhodococcus sp. BP-332]MBY6675318.1 helix-turn-helix domain-containing protein [Rhodococcus sp. BP-332]